MTTAEFKKMVYEADIEQLRVVVTLWAEGRNDFKTFVKDKLMPPVETVDFAAELSRIVSQQVEKRTSRYDFDYITDWSRVQYDLIEPWKKEAENFTTERLQEIVEAIIREVGMVVVEEDFHGDDWYGSDYSGDISDIMECLGNLAGLLLTREDLQDEDVGDLAELVTEAQKHDIIDSYVGTPYKTILAMCKLRKDAGEVVVGIYDEMIHANFELSAGEWVCRKIDFIRSLGLNDEAQAYMVENINYAEVCLKYYNELIANKHFQDAIDLLNKKCEADDDHQFWSMRTPDWRKMKLDLMREIGDRDGENQSLRDLFFNNRCDIEYYHELKKLIAPEKWHDYYHELLDAVVGYDKLGMLAPILKEEGEYEWYYTLLYEHFAKAPTDYDTLLKHTSDLLPFYNNDLRAMIVKAFRAYAALHYAPKKQVRSDNYSYFRADLERLAEIGCQQELRELVEILSEDYRFRPALYKQLQSIKLD